MMRNNKIMMIVISRRKMQVLARIIFLLNMINISKEGTMAKIDHDGGRKFTEEGQDGGVATLNVQTLIKQLVLGYVR